MHHCKHNVLITWLAEVTGCLPIIAIVTRLTGSGRGISWWAFWSRRTDSAVIFHIGICKLSCKHWWKIHLTAVLTMGTKKEEECGWCPAILQNTLWDILSVLPANTWCYLVGFFKTHLFYVVWREELSLYQLLMMAEATSIWSGFETGTTCMLVPSSIIAATGAEKVWFDTDWDTINLLSLESCGWDSSSSFQSWVTSASDHYAIRNVHHTWEFCW